MKESVLQIGAEFKADSQITYLQGNASLFETYMREKTGKENVRIAFHGD